MKKCSFYLYVNKMGGICSRRAIIDNVPSSSYSQNGCSNIGAGLLLDSQALSGKGNCDSAPPNDEENTDKQTREPFSFSTVGINANSNGTYMDSIDDGIPRLSRVLSEKSRSTKSKQVAVAKVSLCYVLF